MTSKQRAYLKSMAVKIEPVMQIGKATVTPELTKAVQEALEARELIKLHVLKNCVAERTHSQVVQVIGKKIVLYKESHTKPDDKKIVLPAAKNNTRFQQ